MTVEIGSIADGQLPATTGDLYTVPAGTTEKIVMTFVNTGAGNNDINIYIQRSGGTARLISPKDMTLATSEKLIFDKEDEVTLSEGDKIQGNSTNANEVDYLITAFTHT